MRETPTHTHTTHAHPRLIHAHAPKLAHNLQLFIKDRTTEQTHESSTETGRGALHKGQDNRTNIPKRELFKKDGQQNKRELFTITFTLSLRLCGASIATQACERGTVLVFGPRVAFSCQAYLPLHVLLLICHHRHHLRQPLIFAFATAGSLSQHHAAGCLI